MSHRASDAASLTISTITLIELFKVCLKAFEFVCQAKVTSRNMQELVSQINIERHRLAIWGRRWGLSTRSPSDIDHDLNIGDIRQMVQNSLTSIEMAVCDLETIQSEYGLSIATATRPVNGADTIPGALSLDPTHHSALRASRQTWGKRIEDRQRMIEKMKTASYSFNDEEKFSQLSKTISRHVQRLWGLLLAHMMPGIERQLVSEVLASITTESELRLVRSVTEISSLRQHTDNDLTARDLARSATEPGASPRRYTMRHRYGTVKTRIPARDDDPLVMADFLQADLIIGKGQKQQRSPVLLEWRNELAPQMEACVNNLAVMLSRFKSGPEAESYRLLDCIGYFEDVRPNTFGMIYRLPSGADPTQCPVSLNELLMEDNEHLVRIPSLDARIQLARCLAISLHELHSSGCLHKQICSQNIVFFKSKPSAKFTDDDLSHPYIVGFGISRPETDHWGTDSRGKNPIVLHRHPHQDSSSPARYHDIYSLGLILLEIARWQPLQDISKGEDIEVESFHDEVLSVAETIDFEVGKTYCNVVQTMLQSVQEYTWMTPRNNFNQGNAQRESVALTDVYEGRVSRDFYYSVLAKLENISI